MIKRYLAAAAVILSLALTACSAPASETTAAPTEAPTTAAETTPETTARVKKTFRNGEADGYGGKVKVAVILQEGELVDMALSGENETPEVGGKALQTMKEAILAAGGTEGVDVVSGATVTSNAVIEAVNAALSVDAK